MEYMGRDDLVDESVMRFRRRGEGPGSTLLDRFVSESRILGVHALHPEVGRDRYTARESCRKAGCRDS